jgi:hypothetical protein
MDWWRRLFDANWLIPMILGFVGGIAWIAFAFRAGWEVGWFEQNAVTVSFGLVRVNLLQLGLGCTCLVLSGFLAVGYFCGDPYEYVP